MQLMEVEKKEREVVMVVGWGGGRRGGVIKGRGLDDVSTDSCCQGRGGKRGRGVNTTKGKAKPTMDGRGAESPLTL